MKILLDMIGTMPNALSDIDISATPFSKKGRNEVEVGNDYQSSRLQQFDFSFYNMPIGLF
jgi:hypothetical protein